MSGLELAAGVIAVVTATGQAAKLTFKLKSLWDDIKEAPDEIRDLLDDLEATGEVLQAIEGQLQDATAPVEAWGTSRLEAVLRRSQLAVKPLEEALGLLQQEVDRSQGKSRRKLVSAKIVLKKPVIDRLEGKLRRALQLLQLSTQIHTVSVITHATTIMTERLPLPVCQSPPQPAEITELHDDSNDGIRDGNENKYVTSQRRPPNKRFKQHYSSRAQNWTWTGRFEFSFSSEGGLLSIQAPTWLARSMYMMIYEKSLGGPQLQLRRYDIIENFDDETLRSFCKDDPAAVFQCLSTKGLSLYLRTKHGKDLLTIASFYGAFKVTAALLDAGLSIFVEEALESGKRDGSSFHTLALTMPNREEILRCWQLVLPYGIPLLLKDNDEIMIMNAYHGLPQNKLDMYRQMFCPGREPMSPEVNLRLSKVYLASPSMSDDISLLLPELDPLAEIPEAPVSRGRCLLHYLAGTMGIAAGMPKQANEFASKLHGWVTKCVLLDPGGLHQLFPEGEEVSRFFEWHAAIPITPFWFLVCTALRSHGLRGISSYSWRSRCIMRSLIDDKVLRCWVSSLRRGGVDLAAYGRTERKLARESPRGFHEIRRSLDDGMQYYAAERRPGRIIGISFGAEVADWGMWWAWEYEFFAREFWNMVENPPLAVPGSWEDACRELERESWEEYVQMDLEEPCDVIWTERR